MRAHLRCLSGWFLNNEPTQIIPVIGTCPCCKAELVWGNIVRKLRKRVNMISKRKKAAQGSQSRTAKAESNLRNVSSSISRSLLSRNSSSSITHEKNRCEDAVKSYLKCSQHSKRIAGDTQTERIPKLSEDTSPQDVKKTSFVINSLLRDTSDSSSSDDVRFFYVFS